MENLPDEIEETIGKETCPCCGFILQKRSDKDWLGSDQYDCVGCSSTYAVTDQHWVKKPMVDKSSTPEGK